MIKRRLRSAALRLLGLAGVTSWLSHPESPLRTAAPSPPSSSADSAQPRTLGDFLALHNPNQYEYPIFVDYPVQPARRYTPEHPHPLLLAMMEQARGTFEHWIREMGSLTERFAAIPLRTRDGDESSEPHWLNGWFPGLDALALYTVIAKTNPARYLEVGSGNSTKFARRAIVDHGLNTTITSIDPQPRAPIQRISDRTIRMPLENTDLGVFGELQKNDILMIDGSHRIFQGSDVTILLLEVLPFLADGVLVHFHDITLPYDYPASWLGRYYSEQYGVAAMLLADHGHRYPLLMANAFISNDRALQALLKTTVLMQPDLAGIEPFGGSLWLRIGQTAAPAR